MVAKRDTAKDAKSSNLLKVVYLCINRLCPDYEGTELGIGESLLVKAIAESTGRNANKIKEDLRKEGDLGKVAMVSDRRRCTLTPELEKRPADNVQAQAVDCSVSVPEPDGHCKGVGKLGELEGGLTELIISHRHAKSASSRSYFLRVRAPKPSSLFAVWKANSG